MIGGRGHCAADYCINATASMKSDPLKLADSVVD